MSRERTWLAIALCAAGGDAGARHYARGAGGASDREPMALAAGEVPADLLARLPIADSHPVPTTAQHGA